MMEINEKIKYFEDENLKIEKTKEDLINSHLSQINKVIEDKIIELKDELREGAINEVCGEEYKVLNEGIAKNNRYIKILQQISEEDEFINVLQEIVPEKASELPETNDCNAPIGNMEQGIVATETVVAGTNSDTLDGKLN